MHPGKRQPAPRCAHGSSVSSANCTGNSCDSTVRPRGFTGTPPPPASLSAPWPVTGHRGSEFYSLSCCISRMRRLLFPYLGQRKAATSNLQLVQWREGKKATWLDFMEQSSGSDFCQVSKLRGLWHSSSVKTARTMASSSSSALGRWCFPALHMLE